MDATTAIIILAALTFLTAALTLMAATTDTFKRKIPIDFGFLLDGKIKNRIEVSTGDPAKNMPLRVRNIKRSILTGIVLDIRFFRPLFLSSTDKALTYFPGKTIHGKAADNSYYHILHTELNIPGHRHVDFNVELNTEGKTPGTYNIGVYAYSTQHDYKFKELNLSIVMK